MFTTLPQSSKKIKTKENNEYLSYESNQLSKFNNYLKKCIIDEQFKYRHPVCAEQIKKN